MLAHCTHPAECPDMMQAERVLLLYSWQGRTTKRPCKTNNSSCSYSSSFQCQKSYTITIYHSSPEYSSASHTRHWSKWKTTMMLIDQVSGFRLQILSVKHVQSKRNRIDSNTDSHQVYSVTKVLYEWSSPSKAFSESTKTELLYIEHRTVWSSILALFLQNFL